MAWVFAQDSGAYSASCLLCSSRKFCEEHCSTFVTIEHGKSGFRSLLVAGCEVVRLLALHPQMEITAVTGESQAGKEFASVFPHLVSALRWIVGTIIRESRRNSQTGAYTVPLFGPLPADVRPEVANSDEDRRRRLDKNRRRFLLLAPRHDPGEQMSLSGPLYMLLSTRPCSPWTPRDVSIPISVILRPSLAQS